MICRVPNVLWVIAGREKLKWEELDSSWEGTLEQHLLGALSFTDTDLFLKTAGIEDNNLIHEIYNLTHGTPVYLDLCVDTYVKLKEKGKEPSIEDFGEDTTVLIKRFLMYMNDAERDFTTMLAFIGERNEITLRTQITLALLNRDMEDIEYIIKTEETKKDKNIAMLDFAYMVKTIIECNKELYNEIK